MVDTITQAFPSGFFKGRFAAEFADSAPAATTDTAGTVKQGAAVADTTGDNPTKAEYNALLASLRAAGIIATS